LALLVLLALQAQAGKFDSPFERARELDQECERQRREKLKPIQEAKAQACIEEGHQEDWCKRYFRDYGWGRPGAGTRAEQLFHDLPVCEEAFRLRKSAQP